MPIAIVRFPDERWRKVNISKFLKKFKSIPASKIIEIPEEELDHVLEILRRNKCDVEIVEPVREDVEIKILKDILRKAEAIRLGIAEPKELEKIAVDAIAKFSLMNLSDDVGDILHDCIDFAEQPFIGDLKDIETRAKEILKRKLSLNIEVES
ncbi:hypothetical protein DRP05_12050 [Archaeoglobales archaeon]|nr:MAG: hypothetical protein DRP05_12050 [Archaeoglobales archaeon]